jgi:2-iminoacetate synthase
MNTFYDIIKNHDWSTVTERIYASNAADVERALGKEHIGMDDFAALVSPAAGPYLKAMAEKSARITRRRFGNVMQLYVPLYLSNYCTNHCVYCGFNCRNQIRRAILDEAAIRREAEALTGKYPFRHILLVTGEAPARSSLTYIGRAIEIMREYFEQVSIEVQPLAVDEYKTLMDKGLHSVYVYQETYNEARYPLYHPRGRKADYRYRLETADRLGEAGIYKTGLGNLIGLEEWRTEAWFTALHLRYLENKYWRTKGSIAFPRLRPYAGEGAFVPEHPASERDLLQLICAYRLISEDVELSISTRESAATRDVILPFGVTTMSAGSSTAPGGYAVPDDRELEQFAIDDARSPAEVAAAIRAKGLEPVWKDWSPSLQEACIGRPEDSPSKFIG